MKGIIFGTEDVRAILDGRKAMTREPIKPHKYRNFAGVWKKLPAPVSDESAGWKSLGINISCDGKEHAEFTSPDGVYPYPARYKPGDILYVKETWKQAYDGSYVYRADRSGDRGICKSPMFMPRAAARIFLRVIDVRVERLQEISEADAIAEGIELREPNHVVGARYRFAQHWNSLNAKRHGGIYAWEKNPWCWCITFERISKDEAEREGVAAWEKQ